jgi:methionine sulfoxide reductase heme-binding subunit
MSSTLTARRPRTHDALAASVVTVLERSDRYRPLRRRIGRRTVGQLLATAVALVPVIGILGSWAAFAIGAIDDHQVIESTLAFGEAPGVVLLAATLWCTPLATVTGRSFVRLRKTFGLAFAACAVSNLVTFLFEEGTVRITRPFAVVGIAAVVMSAPLVATSTNRMIQRVGRTRWNRLHQLTYLIGAAVIAHLWLVPQDDGPGGNIASTVVFASALLLRVRAVRTRLTQLRRRGGSLVALRTWLNPPKLQAISAGESCRPEADRASIEHVQRNENGL